jgi:hypothetical protein
MGYYGVGAVTGDPRGPRPKAFCDGPVASMPVAAPNALRVSPDRQQLHRPPLPSPDTSRAGEGRVNCRGIEVLTVGLVGQRARPSQGAVQGPDTLTARRTRTEGWCFPSGLAGRLDAPSLAPQADLDDHNPARRSEPARCRSFSSPLPTVQLGETQPLLKKLRRRLRPCSSPSHRWASSATDRG